MEHLCVGPARRGTLLGALAALLLLPSIALAQGEATPAATAAPAVPPIASVPLAEVGARSEAVKQAVARRLGEAARLQSLDDLAGQLDTVRDEVVGQEVALIERLGRIAALDTLLELDAEWVQSNTALGALREELQTRAVALATGIQQLEEIGELWALTREEATAASAPSVVIAQIREVQRTIRAASAELTRGRDRILEVQAEAGELAQKIGAARARIATTQAELLTNIFVRDAPAIWSIGSTQETTGQITDRLRAELARQVEATRQLATDQKERAALQLLGTIVLMLLVIAARRRTRTWPREDAQLQEVAAIFEHPYAIALLVGIAATSSIYQAPPRAVRELADLMLLFPALVLISPLLERAMRPALAILAGFYVMDQMRDIVDPLPVVSRVLFSVEMVLVVICAAWLLRRAAGETVAPATASEPRAGAPDDAHAPGSPQDSVAPAGPEQSLQWVIPALIQAVIGVCAIAAVCSALGFQRLARLLGDGVLESAYVGLFLYAVVHATRAFVAFVLRSRLVRPIHTLDNNAERLVDATGKGLKLLATLGWAAIVLQLFGVREVLVDGLAAVLGAELGVGSVAFSIGDVLLFSLTVTVALGLARGVETVLEADIYPRLGTPRGSAYAFSTILRYVVLLVGFLAAMSALGLDTDRLTVLLGAFGVGLGFGLQTIVNSFVSGLILLFERPIQVGDAIEVEGITGVVRRIGIRASIVRTFDGSDVSVPNGNLLSSRLTNWTMSDRHRRLQIPVGVAYGTDPDRVIELLRDVATKHPQILPEPSPMALFLGFGESSLDFELRAWVAENDTWAVVRSELVRGIHHALAEARIEIPFPQRDLHVRTVAPAAPILTATPTAAVAAADAESPVRSRAG